MNKKILIFFVYIFSLKIYCAEIDNGIVLWQDGNEESPYTQHYEFLSKTTPEETIKAAISALNIAQLHLALFFYEGKNELTVSTLKSVLTWIEENLSWMANHGKAFERDTIKSIKQIIQDKIDSKNQKVTAKKKKKKKTLTQVKDASEIALENSIKNAQRFVNEYFNEIDQILIPVKNIYFNRLDKIKANKSLAINEEDELLLQKCNEALKLLNNEDLLDVITFIGDGKNRDRYIQYKNFFAGILKNI